jgi:uncharacterized protein YciI
VTEQLYAIIAYDAPGSDALRVEHRTGHLAHFKTHADHIAVAGPLSGSKGGSLIVYKAANEDEARQFITGDPFHEHGVWATIEVLLFRAGLGTWLADHP